MQTVQTTYRQGDCEVQVIESVFTNKSGKVDIVAKFAFANGNDLVATGDIAPDEYARLGASGNIAENVYNWLT